MWRSYQSSKQPSDVIISDSQLAQCWTGHLQTPPPHPAHVTVLQQHWPLAGLGFHHRALSLAPQPFQPWITVPVPLPDPSIFWHRCYGQHSSSSKVLCNHLGDQDPVPSDPQSICPSCLPWEHHRLLPVAGHAVHIQPSSCDKISVRLLLVFLPLPECNSVRTNVCLSHSSFLLLLLLLNCTQYAHEKH